MTTSDAEQSTEDNPSLRSLMIRTSRIYSTARQAMAYLQLQEMPWHKGEIAMQDAMHVPHNDNPTVPDLSPQLANHIQIAPLVAIGVLRDGRPWTTIWGGRQGLGQPIAKGIIGFRTPVTAKSDPVVEELFGTENAVVKEEGRGRMISGVTIDLEARRRVKFFGRMIAGALNSDDGEVQLVLRVEQSLGNCPKYLNKKHITSATSKPVLISDGPQLPQQAIDLISKADLFFVSSSQDDEDMDTNHRGGPAGFLRCVVTDGTTTLYWPEYSGNRLYQTLGNLKVNPLAGICVPDFDNGDMLYMTGHTEILFGVDAAILPKSNLAIKFTLESARFVQQALPFRGACGDLSPYNPAVRYLGTEKQQPQARGTKHLATLRHQHKITPTVSRYIFSLDSPVAYTPGQYVTFDFSSLLDIGYSHMREDDPRSLNDDFVRTFTVSSRFSDTNEFEITIRHVGVVTEYMSKYRGTDHEDRRQLEVDMKGFDGEFHIAQRNAAEIICFIAGGVGITPLLPAIPDLDLLRLQLLWTIKAADLLLVDDTLRLHPELTNCMTIFVTGNADEQEVQKLVECGVRVERRRISARDVLGAATPRTYLCTSMPLRKQIAAWLPQRELVYEDFDF